MSIQFSGFKPAIESEACYRFHIEWTMGAGNAIASIARQGGVKQGGIVRTGAGVWDLLLDNTYLDFVDWIAFVEQATPAAGGACFVTVVDAVSAAIPKITLTFRTNAFAAVDLANGDIVYTSFSVVNTKR
jgi:hypothetical protein